MKKNRVVITGLGAVSPVGLDVPSTWDAVINGRSGIGPITKFDASSLTTRIAGEVTGFDPDDYLDKKEVRRNDPFVWYAIAAGDQAMKQAGISADDVVPERFGTIVGSGIGGVTTWEAQHTVLMERGPGRVSPFFVPMMITNMAAGVLSLRYRAKGPSYCTTSACASGAHAIGEAFRVISDGLADVMIAGGSEASITPLSLAGFCSMKALSTRNDEPTRASRPFDAERDGFVLSEGAGLLVLESLEHAEKRGATILCELAGYGHTSDAHHITAPSPGGEGAARAMKAALAAAGAGPDAITYVNAHGTSTPLNDRFETMALKSVFEERASSLQISSTKSMTGHLLGAAGSLEAVITAMVVSKNVIPPTINHENPDPECDLDYVPNTAREVKVDAALSNSLGFGGHNVTLMLRKVTGG